jgi:hypothetical protein
MSEKHSAKLLSTLAPVPIPIPAPDQLHPNQFMSLSNSHDHFSKAFILYIFLFLPKTSGGSRQQSRLSDQCDRNRSGLHDDFDSFGLVLSQEVSIPKSDFSATV